MSLQCPRCLSPKVASFHHAMKVGAAIGTVGGVARGVSAAWQVARLAQLSARSLALSASPSVPCRVPSSVAWPVVSVVVHSVPS